MKRITFFVLLLSCLACASDAHERWLQVNTRVEQERRELALNGVRALNTAEINYFRDFGRFAPLAVLASSSSFEKLKQWTGDLGTAARKMSLDSQRQVLPGFELRLVADSASYSLTFVDTTDPCRFAFHSDQEGVIYEGYPISACPGQH